VDKILERPILSVLILFLLCGYLFFFQSGRMALTDPDETFYAQSAKEMLSRHEWLTPYLYNKPQFEKPILFYWLVEISYKIFGINEFASRLPSAIFATLGIVIVYFLGMLFFNKTAAALSAVMLATNVEYVIISRACVTDMVLATFMLCGVFFFFSGYLKEKRLFYLLSAASFALATLTKGPVAIILPAAAIVTYLFLTGDLKAFKKMPIFWAALVFIAIAGPWYLLEYKIHGKDFIDAFFGFQNVTRFLESEHKIGSQVYYNIPIVFGGFFPWSAFLPVGFWYALKRSFSKDAAEKKHFVFLLVWFFVIFIFFSISSTKLPTYIFPLFFSLALLTGAFWDNFLRNNAAAATVRQMKISYYILLAVVIAGSAAALLYIDYRYPAIAKGIFISCLFLILGMLLSLAAFINKKFLWTFILIAYSVAIFLLPLGILGIPEIERLETSKEVSHKLLSLMKDDERLGSESNHLAGLAFYTGKIPIDVDKHDIKLRFLNSDDHIWCVMKEKNHRDLYNPGLELEFVKPSYIVYRLGKRAIVTNKLPDDGKYILRRERPQ